MDVAQSVKRLCGFRDYWLNIPPSHVNLQTTGIAFLRLEGLDNLRNCHSVGCLAGWLTTMPEFRHWFMETYQYSYSELRIALCGEVIPPCYKYLFGIPSERPWGGLFACRGPGDIGSDWEVGLRRLDTQIAIARKDMIP